MKRRTINSDDDGGLDALLDTMTNVVGILVLVLIVTQMGVADVISRIKSETQIDAGQLRQLRQKLVSRQVEQSELHQLLVDPLNIDVEQHQAEFDKKRALLERRRKLLADKSEEKNQYALKIAQDRQQADENQKLIEESEQKRQELQTLISAALEKKVMIEAQLDTKPKRAVTADIEISIPNPRPAPPGGQQVILLCVKNRLYPVNIDGFRKTAEQQSKAFIAKFRLDRDPDAGIDPVAFKKHYERLKQQDDFIRVEYFVVDDRYPRIRLVPREGRGASTKELINPRSRIRSRWLNRFDPAKHYARFFVLPDSYEIYVTARRLFSEAEVLAGWEPQAQTWQLTSGIPGGIELGPRPAQPPVPAPTTPAPPRKPDNVID